METILETLIANFAGRPRKETLNGRSYVVVPVTMIVPGVLAGSKGPLLYPEEEVARNVDAWNGMPLTARHPTINGEAVSARRPEVADKYQLGTIFAANYAGKLVAEAWFDVELTRRIDNRILAYLESGKKIEVSTGLYTHNEVAAVGSVHNGTSYTHIARNYKPDHLAVLMDEVGACSVRQGCGLNVNTLTPEDNSVNKDQYITFLTTNCSCWKGPNATSALNAMTEAELKVLKDQYDATVATNSKLTGITNALTTGFVVNGAKVTLDLTNNTFKAEPIANATPVQAPTQTIEFKPVGVPQDQGRTETFNQLLERTGTPEEKAVWNSAVAVANAEKAGIVDRLTNTIIDPVQKASAIAVYNAMHLPQLRAIAPPAPQQQQTVNGLPPNFALGAGGPLLNQNPISNQVTKVDALPIATLKFENPLNKKTG